MSKAGKLSREEEILLQGFSSDVSKKSNAVFYTISTVVALGPIYLFYGIHQMEPSDSWIVWLISVIVASTLLGTAYRNTKQLLKDQIIVKRGDAIAREVTKQFADDKKISKIEKEQRILWRKSEVGDYEATTFSIFYNNIIFLSTFLVLSFWILGAFNPSINCILSLAAAGGLAALFSTAKQ
uniref:Translocon-associated protein subunit gamma n=1 Tax=Panagrellus redivivus TaxID=6233 RepID=A0A7E4W9K8_PANRE